jgi:hypothetical protein
MQKNDALYTLNTKEEIILDPEDYGLVSKYKWTKMRDGHLVTVQNKVSLLIHRLIMGIPFGDKRVVDHINGNPLDNRKCNLRLCNIAQNLWNQKKSKNNTSGYKGVYIVKKGTPRYLAMITLNKKLTYLGTFKEIADAAKAYDRAAVENFGEFARLNFPDEAA